MCNREHGDLPEQRAQVDAEQENAEDKQDVIHALGQDVLKAEHDVGFNHRGDGLAGEYLGE